jgi:hypothetical protein
MQVSMSEFRRRLPELLAKAWAGERLVVVHRPGNQGKERRFVICREEEMAEVDSIRVIDGKLFGDCGGALEYLGQRIEAVTANGQYRLQMVLLFTDHDQSKEDEIEPGVHYRVYCDISPIISQEPPNAK